MISTYASARGDLATALADAASDWAVHDYPSDAISDRSIVIGVNPSEPSGGARWLRQFIVGVFVRRDAVEAGLDDLDGIVPTLARIDLDGYTFDECSEPRAVTVADSNYLAVFIAVSMETSD